jgi:uncharacterized membrane protein
MFSIAGEGLYAGRDSGEPVTGDYPGEHPHTFTGGTIHRVAVDVKDAHTAGLVGSYDAAVGTKDAKGKVQENKDETSTRHGSWWGIAAGAAVGAIFPPAVLASAAVGGVVGGVTGHLAGGMSRSDAKELGDAIGPGQAGLVVVGESKVEDAVEKALTRAEKQTAKELGVDPKDIDKALQQSVKEM